MIILGIDPGYGRCGFAVLDVQGAETRLVTSGVITTKPQTNFAERLREIAEDFQGLLDRYKPDVVGIEDLFFVANVTTGMNVAHVRGVLIYLSTKFGAILKEPKPVEIKAGFTGNGKASKGEMKKMVELTFGARACPKLDDAADAIAVAWVSR